MSQQKKEAVPWVLGLTGGIGCGKTAVSNLFESFDIAIVDADIVARQVVEPNTEGLTAIVKHFGGAILLSDGTLNRGELRERIFTSQSDKEWLNALLHPLIRQKLLSDINNAKSAYVVLVAPLLFENNLDQYCNRTLLIDVPTHVQIERTIKRDGVSQTQVNAIIASQMSREDKQKKADDILDNNRDIKLVEHDLLFLHETYLQLALK